MNTDHALREIETLCNILQNLFVQTFKNSRLPESSPHTKCNAWQQLADTIAIKFQSLVIREKSPRAIQISNTYAKR